MNILIVEDEAEMLRFLTLELQHEAIASAAVWMAGPFRKSFVR
jgi:DNA-binding response OmpR family regulator